MIVENVAAGYALPEMPCTIAVFGGGANVQWTDAPWLAERQVGYWGDIDTWGFHYLASVRVSQPHVHPILMNLSTVEAHRASMIDEKYYGDGPYVCVTAFWAISNPLINNELGCL